MITENNSLLKFTTEEFKILFKDFYSRPWEENIVKNNTQYNWGKDIRYKGYCGYVAINKSKLPENCYTMIFNIYEHCYWEIKKIMTNDEWVKEVASVKLEILLRTLIG